MGNIKENILKMKDLSELMIDLAYSSLLLQDKRISAEVEKMYTQVITLEKETLRIIFKIKVNDEERIFFIEFADNVREIANIAVQIAKQASAPEFPSIIKDILTATDKRIIVKKISKESVYAGKTIGEVKVSTFTKARIIAIKRREDWFFSINKLTLMETDDTLVAVGSYEAEKLFNEYVAGKIKRI
ncbi:hypothetical protein J4214_00540 [Candidatus Woesearchaeota archaeon]|nr:hypothetical protein [Candidatus Woesearchaeota archaeon]